MFWRMEQKQILKHRKLLISRKILCFSNGRMCFQGCDEIFPPGVFRAGGRGGLPHGWEDMSGKMAVLGRMLALLKVETNDRWTRQSHQVREL